MSDQLRKHVGSQRDHPPWKDIKFRCAFHNTIYDVLKSRGFRETENEMDFDLFWCDKEWIHEVFDHIHLQAHQRVNHFRNHYELTRKDLLVKNIRRAQRQALKEHRCSPCRVGPIPAQGFAACSPTTFVLPLEYSMFVEEFKKQQANGAIWIMKPVGKSQGRGIFLFDKLSQVSSWRQDPKWMRIQKEGEKPKLRNGDEEEEEKKEAEPYVVQRYLSDPLLIGGKKFDLRLYVLVTSYSPLTVYLYRSGFARFSHARFSMDTADLSDAMIHLTNVAVQKHNDHYDEKRGGKWDLHSLKMHLMMTEDPKKVHQLFEDMQNVILFSLLSVQKVMIQDKHCFELYGYDIMISKDFKPWLIEVNASPSLSANTVTDYEMKFALLDDVLTVLDFEKYLQGTEDQIGGFDVLYRNGVRVGPPATAAYRSRLGCCNNREEQLRRLAQHLAGEERNRTPPPPSAVPGRRRR
ncbi:unnamed protein product [Effrenium voratum]|uniref:Tubulin--tyrosine ligase-like protein 9 n=1 Tax=Effrenium voratum TaxID=2562239 RepID=A0AA36NH52_9DINO|nr:unnamed protein product [Effrenium voratum]